MKNITNLEKRIETIEGKSSEELKITITIQGVDKDYEGAAVTATFIEAEKEA